MDIDNLEKLVREPESKFQYSFMQLLDKLNGNALFYPYANEFKYNRVGEKHKISSEYPQFVPHSSDPGCDFNNLSWSRSRLNLTLKVKIPGVVDLGEEAYQHMIVRFYSTYIWRSYSLVRLGVIQVPYLPVSTDYGIYSELLENGVNVGNFIWIPTDDNQTRHCRYNINLSGMPLINQDELTGLPTADEYCRWLLDEYTYEARQKVIRYFEDLISDVIAKESNDDVNRFLLSKGIRSYGYNPPALNEQETQPVKHKSENTVTEFVSSAKGLSSFPKVEDVLARMESGTRQTTAGTLMLTFATAIDLLYKEYRNFGKDIHWVARKVTELREMNLKDLSEVRRKIQRARASVLLGNMWFGDSSTRNGMEVAVDGYQFTLALKQVAE